MKILDCRNDRVTHLDMMNEYQLPNKLSMCMYVRIQRKTTDLVMRMRQMATIVDPILKS